MKCSDCTLSNIGRYAFWTGFPVSSQSFIVRVQNVTILSNKHHPAGHCLIFNHARQMVSICKVRLQIHSVGVQKLLGWLETESPIPSSQALVLVWTYAQNPSTTPTDHWFFYLHHEKVLNNCYTWIFATQHSRYRYCKNYMLQVAHLHHYHCHHSSSSKDAKTLNSNYFLLLLSVDTMYMYHESHVDTIVTTSHTSYIRSKILRPIIWKNTVWCDEWWLMTPRFHPVSSVPFHGVTLVPSSTKPYGMEHNQNLFFSLSV